MQKGQVILYGSLVALSALLLFKLSKFGLRKGKAQQVILRQLSEVMKDYSNQFKQSKIMEKIIPRVFNSEKDLQNLTSNLFYRKENSHLDSLTQSLSQPIWDLLDRGGKRWRPFLCMIIAQLYGTPKENVFDIAALCQIIHNGTLIIDDIEDNSLQRRNKSCIHLIYGVDISVNAGNFMYFAPMQYLLKNNSLSANQIVKMGRIYAQQMTNLHIGQGWDILWHNIDKLQGNYPTQNHYLQMTAHKTGVLARLSSRLVCVYLNLSQRQTNLLGRYAETLGVAFQIQDDLLNLEGGSIAQSKGFIGEDIHQGKITLMVIHFLSSQALKRDKQRLIQILRKKTQNKLEILQAIELMKNAGSFQYARKKMFELIQQMWNQVQKQLPNNHFKTYLHQLAYFSIKRQL